MSHIQRLAVLVLGLWLGAGVFADIAVTRNFSTVERFLVNPGTQQATNEILAIGRDRERDLLRRNAAEENNAIFHDWERAQFVIGAVLIGLLFAERSRPLNIALACAMAAIVAVQDLALSPRIAALGRLFPALPPNDPAVAHFWTMHGLYSGSEIVKLLIGFVLAWSLTAAGSSGASRARVSTEALHTVSRNG